MLLFCRSSLHKAQAEGWLKSSDAPPISHSSPGDWNVLRLFDSIEGEH